MADFWQNLSNRERWLVACGGVLAVVFVILQLVLAPIFDWRSDQRQALSNARSLYELVAEAAPLGGAAMASTAAATQGSPRSVVSSTANAAGVSIVFINARGENGVDVNIASVAPDALFDWLAALRSDYNIVVDNADIARETGNPEAVRAQISMTMRGGS